MSDTKCPICGAGLYFKNMHRGRVGKFWYCEENPSIDNTETHFVGQKNMDWRHDFDMNGFLFRKNFIVRRFGERNTDTLFLDERIRQGCDSSLEQNPKFMVYKRNVDEHPFEIFMRMNDYSSSSFPLEFYLINDIPFSDITNEYLQDFEIME